MPRSKPKPALRPAHHHFTPPTVSARWLLSAIAIVIPAAAFCAWAVLCLLFWQGGWQLLYHPTSTITRTPGNLGLPFDPVRSAPTDTGAPQLQGWWIPSPTARYIVLFLHGQDGNLSDTLDDLSRLHAANVNILAFDYRGYGQSFFVHPSEARMRQDTESALSYLTATRHIDPHTDRSRWHSPWRQPRPRSRRGPPRASRSRPGKSDQLPHERHLRRSSRPPRPRASAGQRPL